MIDGIDLDILEVLSQNGRASNSDIARQLQLSVSGVVDRVRKLEQRGIIKGYNVQLNPKKMGLPLLAFVFVKTNERAGVMSTAQALAEIPGVLEVHDVAGEDCFLCKVRAQDTEALGDILREDFGKIPTITGTRTTIVLQTIKEESQFPIMTDRMEDYEELKALGETYAESK